MSTHPYSLEIHLVRSFCIQHFSRLAHYLLNQICYVTYSDRPAAGQRMSCGKDALSQCHLYIVIIFI